MFEVTRLEDGPLVTGLGGFSKQLIGKAIYQVPVDEDADEKRPFKKGYDLSDVEAVEIAVRLHSAQ